jgi:hypothetical protein
MAPSGKIESGDYTMSLFSAPCILSEVKTAHLSSCNTAGEPNTATLSQDQYTLRLAGSTSRKFGGRYVGGASVPGLSKHNINISRFVELGPKWAIPALLNSHCGGYREQKDGFLQTDFLQT